ncbi:MAG: hypothetical protein PHU85_19505, partial [Phycisphaerae bacterium]|nr:hypothetical protein [Phycisphaerae bacterium]
MFIERPGTWDIPLGRVEHTGTLKPGESYTASLDAVLPALLADDYRIVVRTDVYNHVWEDEYEVNNATRSPDALTTR